MYSLAAPWVLLRPLGHPRRPSPRWGHRSTHGRISSAREFSNPPTLEPCGGDLGVSCYKGGGVSEPHLSSFGPPLGARRPLLMIIFKIIPDHPRFGCKCRSLRGVLGANSALWRGVRASSELLLPRLGGSEPILDDHHRPQGVPRGPLDDHHRCASGANIHYILIFTVKSRCRKVPGWMLGRRSGRHSTDECSRDPYPNL